LKLYAPVEIGAKDARSEAASVNPEALNPLGARNKDLKVGIFPLVMKVHGVGNSCHWLKTDGLPSWRRINDGSGILGSKEYLDSRLSRLN
jgi:hypothetical protein